MQKGSDGGLDFVRHHVWRRVWAASALAALILGTVGNYQYLASEPEGASLGNALYHTAQLFILHSPHFEQHVPWTLEVARWLAPSTIIVGLIGLAQRMLREEAQRRSLQRLRGHVVVCGLGRKGIELVRHLRSGDASERSGVVVIDKDPPPDLAAECQKLGAHLLTEDATRPDALRDAGVERAAQVYAMCPEDATNCEIAVQVADLLEGTEGSTLDCFVHLSTAELGQTLQQALASRMSAGRARLHAVDAFDPEAISLLVQRLPLDHAGVENTDPRGVRLVILGFGRMGRALAVRAAQLGQFANGKRLHIAVIDRHAKSNRDALLFHHPQIEKAADLEFHEHEAVSPAVRELIERFCQDPGFHTSVVVCFDNEALALEVCLRLLPLFDSDTVRVAVRMAHEGGLAHLVERLRSSEPQTLNAPAAASVPESEEARLLLRQLTRLKFFGTGQQLALLSNPEEWPLEKFARQIHEAYVKLTLEPAASDPAEVERLKKKPELQDWSRLSHDLRDSSRLQAAHIFIKLRALGCEVVPATDSRLAKEAFADPRQAIEKFAEPDAQMLARLEHDRWNAERWVAGWVYAEQKDVARRRNPNLVPWEKLPPHIQQYDHDAVGRIPALLATAGLKIVKQAGAPSSPIASA